MVRHQKKLKVSTDVDRDAVVIREKEKITWYSTEKARRGFCSVYGSSLFWDPLDNKKHHWTSIAMGAFDNPTNTKLAKHIFVANKGDYYEITDGLPQNLQ